MDLHELRTHLEGLNWGPRGLTRNEMRDAWAGLPDEFYLRLPDSKRFTSAQEALHEASRSFARAEGEFTAADDDTPPDGAVADGGPPAWGDSPLVSSTGEISATGNLPLAEP